MNKTIIPFVAFCAMTGVVLAQSFTDVNSAQYWGKTKIPELTAALDANFTLMESGAVDGSFDSLAADNGLTVQGTITSISTNGATTNVLVTVDAAIDGEYLVADSVDDDSIDFGDVTGADLTLTDCGAIGCTSLTTGTGEATVDGKYAVVGGDATTGLMIQAASITSTAVGPQTNSFATAFGAAPIVTVSYTEDPGDVQPIYVSDITTTNFVCTVTADKNFNYIAVGQRP